MSPTTLKHLKPIDERIEAYTVSMPNSERKLADLLVVQPSLLAVHSATELAEIAGSSKAAVTRLIKRLGYSGFSQARREAREAQRWGIPAFQANAVNAIAPEKVFQEHLQCDMENLAATYEKLTSSVVDQVVSRLAGARRIGIVGYRNSHALAEYFARQLVLLKDQVLLLPQPGQTIGEDLAHFGPEDMLVVLAFRRRTPLVAQIARHAKKNDIDILMLADPTVTAKDTHATWKILCETRGPALFDSYAAAMSVLNLLASSLTRLPQLQAASRLRKAERLHEELDEL